MVYDIYGLDPNFKNMRCARAPGDEHHFSAHPLESRERDRDRETEIESDRERQRER
jgi:hypothetical protein